MSSAATRVSTAPRLLMAASVLMFCVYVAHIVREVTISQFIEYQPPEDLDLRTFPDAWHRLADQAGSTNATMVVLAVLIAAIAYPAGMRSLAYWALAGGVGLLVALTGVASLTAHHGSERWQLTGRCVLDLVAYCAVSVAAWRGIESATGASSGSPPVRSRRKTTGFGILKEYE